MKDMPTKAQAEVLRTMRNAVVVVPLKTLDRATFMLNLIRRQCSKRTTIACIRRGWLRHRETHVFPTGCQVLTAAGLAALERYENKERST